MKREILFRGFHSCDPDEQCKKLYGEQGLTCPNRTKYGTCKYGDECDYMTHYCRCENIDRGTSDNFYCANGEQLNKQSEGKEVDDC